MTRPRPRQRLASIGLGLLASLVLGCSTMGYVQPEDLGVKILDVDFGIPSSEGLPVTFRVLVTNYSRSSLDVSRVRYKLWVNDSELVDGTLRTLATLAGKKQIEVELPLEVRYDALGKGIRSLVRLSESRYRLAGMVVIDGWFGDVEVPFESKGAISIGG